MDAHLPPIWPCLHNLDHCQSACNWTVHLYFEHVTFGLIWVCFSIHNRSLKSLFFCTLLYLLMIRINGELISSFSSDENGQERFLNQFRCRTHCPRGLYPDRTHYACMPCISNCELCTDGNMCAKCRDQYKLQNGICQLASCDMGKSEAYRLYMNV